MTRRSDPDQWMPLYVGSYLKKTTRLTREQHGAYLLLIMDSWINGAPPDDDQVLASIVKASAAEWRKLRSIIAPFFKIEEGKWCHDKIERERERAAINIEAKRRAGGAGGNAARGKSGRKKNSKKIADAISDGEKNDENQIAKELRKNTPLPLPLPSPNGESSSLRSEGARASPIEIPDWIPNPQWDAFLEMRRKIKAPLTERGKLLVIAELKKMRFTEDIGVVLDQSIMHNWRGVFPVKHEKTNGNRDKKPTAHDNLNTAAANLINRILDPDEPGRCGEVAGDADGAGQPLLGPRLLTGSG